MNYHHENIVVLAPTIAMGLAVAKRFNLNPKCVKSRAETFYGLDRPTILLYGIKLFDGVTWNKLEMVIEPCRATIIEIPESALL